MWSITAHCNQSAFGVKPICDHALSDLENIMIELLMNLQKLCCGIYFSILQGHLCIQNDRHTTINQDALKVWKKEIFLFLVQTQIAATLVVGLV
jgi:hypothetical protein